MTGSSRDMPQIPNPKSQIPRNAQVPTTPTPARMTRSDWDLVIGPFLGIWSLGFGIFSPRPPAARHRLEADAAPDRRGDDPQLRHQAVELRGKHRLRAVAQRVVRVVVHLDDQP